MKASASILASITHFANKTHVDVFLATSVNCENSAEPLTNFREMGFGVWGLGFGVWGLGTYDFGDTGHLTPLVKMHTLGSMFIPPGIHAGGLRYHGMARWFRMCSIWDWRTR